MAHAATALRWQYGEIPAVVTSIGPGALQALAGSLAAASNGVGVYHIYGDETTFGEGYNMQQVPKEEQGLFGQMTAIMGRSYVLHTPEGAARRAAPRRAHRQPSLPRRAVLSAAAAQHPARAPAPQPRSAARAAEAGPARTGLRCAVRGGREADRRRAQGRHQGRRRHARPRRGGAPPRAKPPAPRSCCRPARPACCPTRIAQNMHVGGSKGSISGNYAMARSRAADRHRLARGVPGRLLRHRLQEGASRHQHQRRSRRRHPLQPHDWRSSATSRRSPSASPTGLKPPQAAASKREWLAACAAKKAEWAAYKRARFEAATDPRRGLAAPGAGAAGGHQDRRRLRQADRRRQVLRRRRRAGQRLPDRRGRQDRRHLHRVRRLLHGLRRERAAGLGARRQAALRHRLHRRRLLHDEPADPDRRRRARRPRHDRDLRQPPHGRDHRPAGGAIRRAASAPTMASRSTTCGSPALSAAFVAAARRLDRRRAASRAQSRSRPRRPLGACTCRSTPATTSSPASAPGASGTSATGARTCSALDRAGPVAQRSRSH